MISRACFTEKSLLVVALVLLWTSIGPHPLVIASPLMKGNPLESKARGTVSPSEFVVVEEEAPITLENLNKFVSSQPQARMLRQSPYDAELEDLPIYSRRGDELEGDNARMARLLEQYFRAANSNNRLPRQLASKRAAAMGVDLPDYILHINKGRNFDFSTFREKMQKSG